MTPMIATKLLPPRTGSGVIDRPRLSDVLRLAESCRMILVTAPAGYGKTIAVTQYLSQSSKPFVWFQLDLYDNDPFVFLNYLVTGIRRHYPGFAAKTLDSESLREAAANPRQAVAYIVNSLEVVAESGLIIVFDDYHGIHEPVIHQLLQEFLVLLPDKIQIIITSRTIPPLNLSRLELADDVVKIGADMLRFNDDEIQSFLIQKGIQLGEEDIAQLGQRTNGWPAALRLLSNTAHVDALADSSLKMDGVYAYLAAEILDMQSEEIQEFLLATSVLDVMTPETCDRLLQRTDSSQIFAYLEEQQLFLIPLTGQNRAYRYHQLFRDFLLEQLGEECISLRRRAGRIASELGDKDQAVEFMLSAGIDSETLSLVIEAGLLAFRQGRWLTVARWLEQIDVERIQAEPWLCFFHAQVFVFRGQLDQAEHWAVQAERGFATNQEPFGLVESQILRAKIMRCWGNYQQSITLLDEMAAKLSPQALKTRFDIPFERSICLLFLGRLYEAECVLDEALQEAKKHRDVYLMAHLAEGLGIICCVEGKYAESMRYFNYGLQISPNRHLPGYYMQDSIAQIYKDWGHLDQALEHAIRSVTIKENLGIVESLPFAYSQLGYVYLEVGDLDMAHEYFERGLEAARKGRGDYHYQILNHCFLGWVCFMQNRRIEGRALVEEAFGEAEKLGGFIYPACEVIAGTVLAECDESERAQMLLEEAALLLEKMGARVMLCNTYKALAWHHDRRGEVDKSQDYARKYLELAVQFNYLRCFLPTTYHLLRPVLKHGLVQGIEVPFIQRILLQLGESAVELLEELAVEHDMTIRSRIIPPLKDIGGDKALSLMTAIEQSAASSRIISTPKRQPQSVDSWDCYLRLGVFGAFRVFINNQEIPSSDWRTTKSRELLAYLAHHDHPVSTAQILDDLWPNYDPDKAVANFHTTLYYLRQTLRRYMKKDPIVHGSKRYQLNPGIVVNDRLQFEELTSVYLRKSLNESDIEDLEEAASLYRGDYLVDLDYVWIISKQEDLKNIYFEIKQKLARHYLELRRFSKAVAHLQQLLTVKPFSEETLVLLLKALAENGDYQGLRDHYLAYAKALSEELGLAPSPEVTASFEEIRSKAGSA